MKLLHHLKYITIILLLSTAAIAQNPTKWRLDSDSKGKEISKEAAVSVKLIAEVEPGWHLYALDQPDGGPIATTIKVPVGNMFEIAGKILTPQPQIKPDNNFIINGKALETKFFTERAEFTVPLKALENAPSDAIALDVRFQLCNDTFCLPPRSKRVTFAGEEDVKKVGGIPEAVVESPGQSSAPTPTQAINSQTPTDIWSFIWLAATLGALSLLTPCVFPMIPITVSYFTNH